MASFEDNLFNESLHSPVKRYFKTSNRLAIRYDVYHTEFHQYLIGISLYAWSGSSMQLIATRSLDNEVEMEQFEEMQAKAYSIQLLTDYLHEQATQLGQFVNILELLPFSFQMVEDANLSCEFSV